MESISVFDIFKLGVGPSSSHTMGPWRAARRFLALGREAGVLGRVVRLRVDLFGSLAKTGKGHGTDMAVIMGLLDEDPETVDPGTIAARLAAARAAKSIQPGSGGGLPFDPAADLVFNRAVTLPYHPNGIRFAATLDDGSVMEETWYSIGGGFIKQEGEAASGSAAMALPMPIDRAEDLLRHCRENRLAVPEVVRANEAAWRNPGEVEAGLERIWIAMRDCVYRGCHAEGTLPGGLGVARRAAEINRRLLEGAPAYDGPEEWMERIRRGVWSFQDVLKWVSCFALAVNEENAAFGRVVTAPTNGAAGVIPAVLMYAQCFPAAGGKAAAGGRAPRGGKATATDPGRREASARARADFLLTAGEFGSLFKKGATLSAALGGCQAEIGVSSAMAAAGLAQILGGEADRDMMAAEIAMEHHLGMTCDPVGGLVQVPCIERNAMGAVKAITACNLALEGDPAKAKVTLDAVIRTMWETAKDMDTRYKETSEGGLAGQIAVNVAEC